MTDSSPEALAALHAKAYDAMHRGDLREASLAFERLLAQRPDQHYYHYMRGLAHKYLLDWPVSLHHNLRAIELADEMDEAEHWNAAIAATALGEWAQARRLWADCGVRVQEGEGPIEGDYGVAVVRLNPWHAGETVFMRRIDPVRARLLNVPLPESGHRFGDIVLHDGASTGSRLDGEREVPVFNELERLVASEFQTFVVFASCPGPDDLEALLAASVPGLGYTEDWTGSIRNYCMRCSYGAPHRHAEKDEADDGWRVERHLGIAAQSRHSIEALLQGWASQAPGRSVDAIETRECPVPEYREGGNWWVGPEGEEEETAEDAVDESPR
nr:hypothetical protein [Pseudoxanthomonas sp.]